MILNQEIVDQEEESIRQKVRQLSDNEKASYFKSLSKNLKDPDTYAALNWSLFVGFHHLYLKEYYRALFDWIAVFIGIALLINDFLVGAMFIIIVSLFEIYQLFRSQVIVQNYNNQQKKNLLSSYSAINKTNEAR